MIRLAALMLVAALSGCTSLPTAPSVPAASESGSVLADGLSAEITPPRDVRATGLVVSSLIDQTDP